MAQADILVVEDELPLATMMQANLEGQGHAVRCAHNGREALEMVEAQIPDLMILDILLPEMSGWQVLEKLRSDPKTEEIPIIVLTCLGEDRDVAKGWGLGSDCYMVKPFEMEDLVTLVERFLAEKPGTR